MLSAGMEGKFQGCGTVLGSGWRFSFVTCRPRFSGSRPGLLAPPLSGPAHPIWDHCDCKDFFGFPLTAIHEEHKREFISQWKAFVYHADICCEHEALFGLTFKD
jgi:hypothetical protein